VFSQDILCKESITITKKNSNFYYRTYRTWLLAPPPANCNQFTANRPAAPRSDVGTPVA
jgi:hypothetical protein